MLSGSQTCWATDPLDRVASARVREVVSGSGVGWAVDESDEVCSGSGNHRGEQH